MLHESDRRQPRGSRAAVMWALGAVVLLGAILRLHALSDRSLWVDEAITLYFAGVDGDGQHPFDTEYTSEPPLFHFLVNTWARVLQPWLSGAMDHATRDLLLRLMPCLIGVLSIPLVFAAGRTVLKSDSAALIGAFLFTISPFQICYAQELRGYSLHCALATGALILYVKATKKNTPLYWIGWTLCAALAIYNHFFFVWIVVAFNIHFVLALKGRSKLLKPWILCNLAVILLASPSIRMAFTVSSVYETAKEQWYPYPTLRIMLITFKNFFAGYSPNRVAYSMLFVAALGLTAIAAFSLRKRPRALLLLAVMALAPMAVAAIYWRTSSFPYYTHRLMISCAVPCYLLVAQGVTALRPRVFAALALALVAAFTAPALADHYANRIHPLRNHRVGVLRRIENREGALFIADHLKEGETIAHRVRYTLLPFRHYLKEANPRQGLVCFTADNQRSVNRGYPLQAPFVHAGVVPERIEDFTAGVQSLWFVRSFWEPDKPDPEGDLLVAWLDAHMFREFRRPFEGLTVYRYQNDPPLKLTTDTFLLADRGEWQLPYYAFCGSNERTSVEQEWPRVAFNTTAGAWDSKSGFGLLVDLAERDGAPGIGPADSVTVDSDDAFSYGFSVINGTEARTLECRVYEAAKVIEPLSFTREDPVSDVWQPVLQYDAGPPEGAFNVPAMLVKFSNGEPDGSAVFSDVQLDGGRYEVWAHMIQVDDPVTRERAEVRFSFAPLEVSEELESYNAIGATDGADPSRSGGWGWRRLGLIDCTSGAYRVRATAHNTHNLPRAFFDLGRIVFVRPTASTETPPFLVRRFKIKLDESEIRNFTQESKMDAAPTKRVDVEVFDATAREFRRIYFTASCSERAQ